MGMVKKETKALPALPPVPEVPTSAFDKMVKTGTKLVEKAGDDKILAAVITKTQPVDARSASIERQALIKSVLESPTLAQRVIGLNQADAFKEFEAWFAKAVEVFYSK